jgi:hypothetical protein
MRQDGGDASEDVNAPWKPPYHGIAGQCGLVIMKDSAVAKNGQADAAPEQNTRADTVVRDYREFSCRSSVAKAVRVRIAQGIAHTPIEVFINVNLFCFAYRRT